MAKYIKTEEGYKQLEEIGVATVESVDNAQVTAENAQTTANEAKSTADNARTTANGKMDKNNPVGYGSFSMNRLSGSTIGDCSHAEGMVTTASGYYSHAEGRSTIASGRSQHTEGEYNIDDANDASDARSKYVHIVGNGISKDKRSNAHTLDWNGNAWYAGDVYVGSTSGTNRDEGSKKLATEEKVTELAIKTPEAASVGQTIVVKSVDENGKPTEWESADYQPRTHWRDVAGTPLVEEQTASRLPNINLINGRYYLVVWDGVEYVCECKICTYKDTSSDGETRGHYLGNPSRIDWSRVPGTDNGIPFTVVKEDWGGLSCYYDDSETHTISIYQVDMNKIPAEYLPSGSAYSRFKPTVFCEETTVTTADLMGNGMQIAVLPSVTIPLVDGLVYDVLWNGTKYTCEAFFHEGFGIAMGNRRFFVSNWENTGEPFVMGFSQGAFMVMAYGATEPVTATVSIVEHTKIVEKLDDAYYDRAFFVDINEKDDGTYFTTVTPEALKDAYYRNIPIFAQMKHDGTTLSSFVPLTYAFPTDKLGLWSFCGIVEGYIMKIHLNSLDEGISNGIPVEVSHKSFDELIDARLKTLGLIE